MKIKSFVLASLSTLLFSCTANDLYPDIDSTSSEATEIYSSTAYVSILDSVCTIDSEKAKSVARLFTKQFSGANTRAATEKEISTVELVKSETGENLYYAVNFANNQGFVLVSATRNNLPVLAYSDEGNFDIYTSNKSGVSAWRDEQASMSDAIAEMPDSIQKYYRSSWLPYDLKQKALPLTRGADDIMKMVEDSIAKWHREGYTVYRFSDIWDTEIYDELPSDVTYEALIGRDSVDPMFFNNSGDFVFILQGNYRNETNVAPLLKTKWAQDGGYAQEIDNNYPVGCVAVAMGQIMKFWEYPIAYNWDQMADTYATPTTASFLAGVGGSVHTDYSADGSSSNINEALNAFKTVYGYTEAVILDRFDEHSAFQNIEKGYPVYMRGEGKCYNASTGKTETVGHAWVGDGVEHWENGEIYKVFILEDTYTANTEPTELSQIYKKVTNSSRHYYFHMNWGWGGQNDGYYFSPQIKDAYGNSYNFSSKMKSIQHIVPPYITW